MSAKLAIRGVYKDRHAQGGVTMATAESPFTKWLSQSKASVSDAPRCALTSRNSLSSLFVSFLSVRRPHVQRVGCYGTDCRLQNTDVWKLESFQPCPLRV